MIKNLSINSKFKKLKKSEVHKLLGSLKQELNFSVEALIINFIDREEITEINKEFLKHDFSTDIITFNYSGSNTLIDGEIYISVGDAQINAAKFKVSESDELTRLVIHGVLHLLGYDDKNPDEKKIMKSLENRLTYKNNFTLL